MKLLILATMTLISATSFAEELFSYKLTVVRDGKKQERVAYPAWSGEYPSPVIDVQSNKPGKTTTVKGYASLREPKNKKSCTIKNGLYHPWSTTESSAINLYSIIGVNDVQALHDIDVKGEADGTDFIKKGDQILNVYYMAENYCGGTLKAGKKLTEIGFSCDLIGEEEGSFKQVKKTEAPTEQWIYLQCAEGYNVFVQDGKLLNQPKVKQGNITGYGEITGAN